MRPLVPLPPELVDRAFTLAEAATYGLTRDMLRGRRFRQVMREVYVRADLEVTHAMLAQAVCRLAPAAVLSDASAAAAFGLPLAVDELELTLVQITVAEGVRAPRRSLVVVHRRRLAAHEITESPLGPATVPARTYLDRATELDLPDLVALGDAILRRRLASREDLERAVREAKGVPGVRRAKAGLALLDPRAASAMESRLRVVLVLGGCGSPEVNADIHDRDGCWIATGDLVWRAARLILEYDGRVHLTERQRRADLARRNDLVIEGWTVLQVSADDLLKRPDQLIARVRQLLAQAA